MNIDLFLIISVALFSWRLLDTLSAISLFLMNPNCSPVLLKIVGIEGEITLTSNLRSSKVPWLIRWTKNITCEVWANKDPDLLRAAGRAIPNAVINWPVRLTGRKIREAKDGQNWAHTFTTPEVYYSGVGKEMDLVWLSRPNYPKNVRAPSLYVRGLVLRSRYREG